MNFKLKYDNYQTAVEKTAEHLIKLHGKEEAESIAYKYPDSSKELNRAGELFENCIKHHIVQETQSMVKNLEEYRMGDIWAIDAVEANERVSEDVYEKIQEL